MDVAPQIARLGDEHGLLRLQIALDRALDFDDLRLDVRFDLAFLAHRHALRVMDRSLDLSLDQEILVGRQFPLEFQARRQHGHALARRIVRIGHAGSPSLSLCQKGSGANCAV